MSKIGEPEPVVETMERALGGYPFAGGFSEAQIRRMVREELVLAFAPVVESMRGALRASFVFIGADDDKGE